MVAKPGAASAPPPAADAPGSEGTAGVGGRKKKRKTKAPPGDAEDAAVEVAEAGEGAASRGAAVAGIVRPAEGDSPPEGPLGTSRSCSEVLAWLAWPLSPATFFDEYWEKKPLHLRRGRPQYYGDAFSKAALDRHLKEGTPLGYGERINLARTDPSVGKKVDLNRGAKGELAEFAEVEEAWSRGASVQVMHMQQFHEPVWRLLAAMERSFGALFGANAYLTPGGEQGFAPHFDDVEVFMMQLEGSKRWRIYEPPLGEEFPLPREYSRDFLPSELGEPVLDCVLEPGDLLYLPRGSVHAGVAVGDGFSHHLTVSTYQKTAWCHLLERTLSSAVERAASSSAEFREGLPLGFLRYMGSWYDCADDVAPNASLLVAGSGEEDRRGGRAAFMRHFKGLLKRLHDFIDVDEACDELGVEFMSSRLPPPAKSSDSKLSSNRASSSSKNPEDTTSDIDLETAVRWIDVSSVRAMLSTDPETSEATVMLFHSCDNNRGGHMSGSAQSASVEEEVGCLRFEAATFLRAVRALLALPEGASMRCGDIPLKSEEDRVALCENLVEAKLLEVVAATSAK